MAFTIKIRLIGHGYDSRRVTPIQMHNLTLNNLDKAILATQRQKILFVDDKFQNARKIFLRDVPLTADSIRQLLKNGATYRVYFYKLDNCPELCDVYLFEEE